jgi:hypothetical protein
MSKEPKKKVASRWGRNSLGNPNTRYDGKVQTEIDKKYHESFGWKNGAKVRRK